MENRQSPPAAWHPDPDDPTQLRYWDGTAWTDHRAPAPVPAPSVRPAPTVAAAPVAASVPGFSASPTGVDIENSPGGSVVRASGGIAALWTLITLVRINRLIEGDGTLLGVDLFGYSEWSPWRFFDPIWPGSGDIGSEVSWLNDPFDRIVLSPYLWLSAAVGVVGLLVLLTPTRTLARSLAIVVAAHVLIGLVVVVETSFWGESIRYVVVGSAIPMACAAGAMVASARRSSMATSSVAASQF